MKRLTPFAVLVVACSFVLAGFADVNAQTAPSKPRYGGILKMHGYEPYSLGYPPTMTAQTDGQQSSVCLESLFRFDEKGEVIPLLATNWKARPRPKR
jgi:ABC-type transport system substrate-binding protein